jgi:diaminopimelate epimerase
MEANRMEPPVVGAGFYKGHGLGNDYLVFEAAEAGRTAEVPAHGGEGTWRAAPEAVRAICRRWTGVGGDGIVVVAAEADGSFPARMFNPDGTEFERSGNGLRILASHLWRTDRVSEDPFVVRSGGSRIGMRVHGVDAEGRYDVSVEMGRAETGGRHVGFEPEGAERADVLRHPARGDITFHPVSVGNPHAVMFTDDLSDEALRDLGPFLSGHPAFRRGTNVQLARVDGPRRVRIAIWERGVGRTSASGTSSCAVAVACVARGIFEPGAIEVDMEGGRLEVHVGPELDVVLRGPVEEVATGRLTERFLQGLARLPTSRPEGPPRPRS